MLLAGSSGRALLTTGSASTTGEVGAEHLLKLPLLSAGHQAQTRDKRSRATSEHEGSGQQAEVSATRMVSWCAKKKRRAT